MTTTNYSGLEPTLATGDTVDNSPCLGGAKAQPRARSCWCCGQYHYTISNYCSSECGTRHAEITQPRVNSSPRLAHQCPTCGSTWMWKSVDQPRVCPNVNCGY